MSYFQPTLTLYGTKGKSSTNNNWREKPKPFCMYIWIRVNVISRVYSWDDLFPLRLSIRFWMGWQANDSGADSSISCRNRTGERCIVSPLDNELDFLLQPRFLQDKPRYDRLVVDEATQPEDFLYVFTNIPTIYSAKKAGKVLHKSFRLSRQQISVSCKRLPRQAFEQDALGVIIPMLSPGSPPS